MVDLKTRPTAASVDAFLATIEDEEKRRDCKTVLRIMKRATKTKPKMWGTSIVGFGAYYYRYARGSEGVMLMTGFSPRKRDLTLYIAAGFERYAVLIKKLGKHKTGKSCLYLKRLADVDLEVLEELVAASFEHMKKTRG